MPRPAAETRLDDVLNAALALLREGGLAAVTTNALAARAKCSKVTLYELFDDRDAILAALIARQAERLNQTLEQGLNVDGASPDEQLAQAGAQLYRLLLSEASLVINRAAISDPTGRLSAILIANGQAKSAPHIARLIRAVCVTHNRAAADLSHAYQCFYGLLMADQQILALHGARSADPSREESSAAGRRAVDGLRAMLLRLPSTASSNG